MKEFEHKIIKSLINSMFPYSNIVDMVSGANDNTVSYMLYENTVFSYNNQNQASVYNKVTNRKETYNFTDMRDLMDFVTNTAIDFGIKLFFIY